MSKPTYKRAGTYIDRINALEEEIEKHDAKIKPKKALVAKLRGELLEHFTKEHLAGAKGANGGGASMVKKTSYKVADYSKFKRYIIKEDAYDLLQLRVHGTAYQDRVKERKGRPIPGIKVETANILRITKPKS